MKKFVNALSIFRIIAAFLIVPLMLEQLFFDAFVIFVLAAASDWLDGFLARRYKVTSKLGGVLDQIGDKFLIVNALIMMIMFLQIWQVIIPAILMIGRELYVSGLREFLGTQKIEMPVPKNKFAIVKLKTTAQMLAIAMLLVWIWGVNEDWKWIDGLHYLLLSSIAVLWAAMTLSLLSAAQYTNTFVKHIKKGK